MPDGHEHCRRVLNYDAWRNVVFCSKCKTQWYEITVAMEVSPVMTAAAGERTVVMMDAAPPVAMPAPVTPKRRRKA